MLVRVGPEAHARMLQEPHASPMEMRGRVMTGFVRVAPDGYQSDADLKNWVKRGLDFVAATTAGRKAAPRKAVAAKTKVAAKAKAPPRDRARKGLRR